MVRFGYIIVELYSLACSTYPLALLLGHGQSQLILICAVAYTEVALRAGV